MVFINGQPVTVGDNIQETFHNVLRVLREQQLVAVDESGQPLSEDRIFLLLQTDGAVFQAIPVTQLEQATIDDVLEYLQYAIEQVSHLTQTDDRQLLYRSFANLMESLLHLNQLGQYFGLADLQPDKLHSLANRALAQIQLDNDSYVRDLLEYECLPVLESFKCFLDERKALR